MGRKSKKKRQIERFSDKHPLGALTQEGEIKLAQYQSRKAMWEALRTPLVVFSFVAVLLILYFVPEELVEKASQFFKVPTIIIIIITIIMSIFTYITQNFSKILTSRDDN